MPNLPNLYNVFNKLIINSLSNPYFLSVAVFCVNCSIYANECCRNTTKLPQRHRGHGEKITTVKHREKITTEREA